MVKPISPKPTVTTPNNSEEGAQSGVQLSRQALYVQRMNEIYNDVHEGRCNFDEAVERAVDACLARKGDLFTPRGRVLLAAQLREICERNPRLRKALTP